MVEELDIKTLKVIDGDIVKIDKISIILIKRVREMLNIEINNIKYDVTLLEGKLKIKQKELNEIDILMDEKRRSYNEKWSNKKTL